MLKKIFINFVFILLLLAIAEFFAFSILVFKYRENFYNAYIAGDPVSSLFPHVRLFHPDLYDKDYRRPLIGNNKTIFIFGCSFGFGDGLNDNQNFSGKLHKLTDYSVFNRSEGGVGPQVMLYQFESKKVLDLSDECDYIIYVYMPDHLRRNLMFRCFPFLYKVSVRYMLDKNDDLVFQTCPFLLANSNIYRLYEAALPEIYGEKYSLQLLYKLIEKSYKLSKEYYPNSKFILLNYGNDEDFSRELKLKLENLGVYVVSVSELTNKDLFKVEYQISKYDHHPNEKAWNEITPDFIKKFSMI